MEKENKKKALLEVKMFLATIILLAVLIAVSGICSYVIPAGAYEKTVVNGISQQVYHTIVQTPLPNLENCPFTFSGSWQQQWGKNHCTHTFYFYYWWKFLDHE